MTSAALDFALAFAKAGFHLHPCRQDKRPHLEGWPDKATTDTDQIKAWAAQYPGCRWGVAAGKSGLVILDSDKKPDKNGENTIALLEADLGKLPPTYTVRTISGGLHRYYKGICKTTAGNLGPALDTRSAGGYAIIPDGTDYVPTTNLPIAEAPQWVLERAGRPGEKERPKDADTPAQGVDIDRMERIMDAIEYVRRHAPGAAHGERDVNTYKVACAVRDFGLSHQSTLKILTEFWAEREDVHLSDDFDLHHIRWKVDQAYKTAQNKLGANLPEALFTPVTTSNSMFAFDAGNIDSRLIPKREWLLGTWMIKRFLTVTVAPGGTGKSNLSILEALAVATGKQVSGDYVHEKGHVWVHNGEDPLDELARRFASACRVHGIKPHEIKGRLFYTSGRTTPLKLVISNGRHVTVNQAAISQIKDFIRAHDIKLWVVDPFVDMHDCDENDNTAINTVAKVLSHLAEETGCAVHVVHHTRKRGKDGAITSMDEGRGASSLSGAARIMRNLNVMSEKDADKFVLTKAPHWYIRLDSSKANMAQPNERTQWFERVEDKLDNGDTAGALKPVELVEFGAGSKDDQMRERAVEIIEEHGGSVSLNTAAAIMEEEGLFDMLRPGIIKRMKRKVFSRSYHKADGAVYALVPGEKGVMKLVREGAENG